MPETSAAKKREVAYKVSIKDLVNGAYERANEEWAPNYVLTSDGKKVSRVNLIGVVVSKMPDSIAGQENFILDDGTEKVSLRFFDLPLTEKNAEVGVVINLIGRPREFNGSLFIVPEIIVPLKNKKWIEVRKKELSSGKPQAVEKSNLKNNFTPVKTEKDIPPAQKIFQLIKELDKGDGANVADIINKSDAPNAEEIIKTLQKEGEVFEAKPGRIKILD